jgi:hypothetical protein
MGQPRRALVMAGLARRRSRTAWLFLAPAAVALALVAGWPLARTIWFAFTDATLATLDDYDFVGFLNFAYLLRDPVWWGAVWNTLLFAAISVTLESVLGLGIAFVLDARLRGRGLLRAAVLVPWAIPTVVSAQMWRWMYNDLYGIVNTALLALGLIAQPIAWLADPTLSLGGSRSASTSRSGASSATSSGTSTEQARRSTRAWLARAAKPRITPSRPRKAESVARRRVAGGTMIGSRTGGSAKPRWRRAATTESRLKRA